MIPARWPDKDPAEALDFTYDWSAVIPDGDSIATVVWTVPAGITKDSQSNTATAAVIWLSGGTNHTDYLIVCTITTAQARTFERTIAITVCDR